MLAVTTEELNGLRGSMSLADAIVLGGVVGPGLGLEVVSKVNDIPKGSRLAVSTNLLAALVSVLGLLFPIFTQFVVDKVIVDRDVGQERPELLVVGLRHRGHRGRARVMRRGARERRVAGQAQRERGRWANGELE